MQVASGMPLFSSGQHQADMMMMMMCSPLQDFVPSSSFMQKKAYKHVQCTAYVQNSFKSFRRFSRDKLTYLPLRITGKVFIIVISITNSLRLTDFRQCDLPVLATVQKDHNLYGVRVKSDDRHQTRY